MNEIWRTKWRRHGGQNGPPPGARPALRERTGLAWRRPVVRARGARRHEEAGALPSGVPLSRFPCVGRKTKSGEAAVGRRSWRTMAASATQNLGERGDTRSFSVYRRARPAVRSAGQERARQTRPCRLATSLSPARHRHRSLFFPARKKTVKKPTVARSIAIRQGKIWWYKL